MREDSSFAEERESYPCAPAHRPRRQRPRSGVGSRLHAKAIVARLADRRLDLPTCRLGWSAASQCEAEHEALVGVFHLWSEQVAELREPIADRLLVDAELVCHGALVTVKVEPAA